MKAKGLNQVFFATIVFGLNGYFIANVCCGNEDYLEDLRLEDISQHETRINEDMLIKAVVPDNFLPKFTEPLHNVTVTVGREASLTCVIENLNSYKIAWLRVDTQTILTIQTHVITKNHRMVIVFAENHRWILKIRDVKESDKGWYMCQINTDPMKCQTGYLDVVVPPDILDHPTSTDMVVKEGSNVTLKCAATGSPSPIITWRREDGEPITHVNGIETTSYNGSTLNLIRVDRLTMGAYLCIASNGIPPSVSKRMLLIVHFSPMISIQNQLVGAAIGQRISLECQSEAFPNSINYWMKNHTTIVSDNRVISERFENSYKVIMKLIIIAVEFSDFGTYQCKAKNSLGDTDGTIKLYHIPHAAITSTTTIMPSPVTVSLATMVTVMHNNNNKVDLIKDKLPTYKSSLDLTSTNNNILIGATGSGGHWNTAADSRDRILDYRIKTDGISSTEVQRDVDLLQNENEISSSSSSTASAFTINLSLKQLNGMTTTKSSTAASILLMSILQITIMKIFNIAAHHHHHHHHQ